MFRRIARWALWSQPRAEIAYVLGAELVAAGAVSWGITADTAVAGTDWLRWATLLGCATVHVFFSRRQEETRRTHTATLHVELTSIWTFPAALVLPIPLAVLLIVIIRAQRWFVARRPPYRFVFSSMVLGSAAVAVNRLLTGLGRPVWVAGSWPVSAQVLGILLLAALVYTALQVLVVGAAVALHIPSPTVAAALGTRFDNGLELLTAGLGMVTAVLLVDMPALLVVMVVLAVAGNSVAEVRQLHADARTDAKTELLNMRGWRDRAIRDLTRAERSGEPVGLLMIDLDHFKTINDTWGHPAGDDMLRAVGGVLREETRPADVLGRFGGEEFVVLLPGAGRSEAAVVAKRILDSVREVQVFTTDKRGGPAVIEDRSASIGVASHPEDATTLDELLQAADAAVYEAKDAGRDRVWPA